jgi:hypothetical protein
VVRRLGLEFRAIRVVVQAEACVERKPEQKRLASRVIILATSGNGYFRTLSPCQNNFRFPVISGHFYHQFHFSIFDVRFVGAERKSFKVAEKGRS